MVTKGSRVNFMFPGLPVTCTFNITQMFAELMKLWSGQFTMIQVTSFHFGMNSIQWPRLKSANISVCTTMGVTSPVRPIVFVHLSYPFFFKKNYLEDMSPFCETLIPPVLNFWWRLLWVSKPEGVALFSLRCVPYTFPRFTSGVTPADLLVARMAAESFSSI